MPRLLKSSHVHDLFFVCLFCCCCHCKIDQIPSGSWSAGAFRPHANKIVFLPTQSWSAQFHELLDCAGFSQPYANMWCTISAVASGSTLATILFIEAMHLFVLVKLVVCLGNNSKRKLRVAYLWTTGRCSTCTMCKCRHLPVINRVNNTKQTIF